MIKHIKNFKNMYVKKTSFVLKNLKASKKYYVKVRSYALDGKKNVYGKWSTVKTIKKY